jgi:dienelactone hydrolase
MRSPFIVVSLLLTACSVSGGRLARLPSPLPVSPATSPFAGETRAQWIYLEGSGGKRFLTAIMSPDGTARFPVVVILHGSDGLTKQYMAVAEHVARAGFLVVIGCWQAGQAGTAGNKLCSDATPQSAWVSDPAGNSGKELIALARSLPNAKPDRVAIYGLSRGGHAALWAASTGANVQAVVVDAAGHAPVISPAPPTTLSVVAGLNAPVLLMHGTSDALVPVQQSREYEAAARVAGKQVEVAYFAGAGHMVSLVPEFQAEARSRAIAFLRKHLSR